MKKIASVLVVLFILCITTSAQDVTIPILLYHNVTYDYNQADDLINITPDRLGEHLQALKDDGFNAISYMDYYNFVTGKAELPPKPIIIAFDDGYINNYEYAYPILKQKGMKATIFIVTSTVGKTPGIIAHFSWEQANEMQASGVIDIESHTHTHRDLTSMSDGEVQSEIRVSKYLIEKNMNKKCLFLAYPFGFTNEKIYEYGKKAGYLMQSRVGNVGSNSIGNAYEPLNRLTVSGSLTGSQLLDYIYNNL